MTNHDALLRAVLEVPADDAPRLVFADWLDEHGHPERAEFIRVQLQMEARWPLDQPRCPECGCDPGSEHRLVAVGSHPPDCRWFQLWTRQADLWNGNARRWAGLSESGPHAWEFLAHGRHQYRAGFLESVEVPF